MNTRRQVQLGEEGFLSAVFPGCSPSQWEARAQELRGVGHVSTAIARNRELGTPHACAQLAFFTVVQFRVPCLGNAATHTGLGVQISVTYSR